MAAYGKTTFNCDERSATNLIYNYDRTNLQSEEMYCGWLAEGPNSRPLKIVRLPVILSERNHSTAYNLLRKIANKKFIMVDRDDNIKPMAYFENLATLIQV